MSRPLRAARVAWLVAALAAAAALGAAPRAGADVFGAISLASEGSLDGAPPQQVEYAHDAAISGNGRYVAFDGSVGGMTGVWRRDLATGAIEAVAPGDSELPSISASGRYVSFTSTEDLVPADEALGPNVWVRDMEPGPGEAEYVLASAVDGSSRALTYEYGTEPSSEEAKYGAAAVGRSAISADGQEVAFVTTAVSNLAGPHTPALQVAVRYLETERTELVSGEYDAATGQTTETPVFSEEQGHRFGAVFTGPGANPGFRAPPPDGNWEVHPPIGASISGDGSAVAWLGDDIARQAPMLAAEHPPSLYTEPLWRRIEPGSETPTERVTGGSEPENPACAASGESALPGSFPASGSDPCQGPFQVELATSAEEPVGIWTEHAGAPNESVDFVPRLSEDGERVAFVASAVPLSLGLGFTSSDGEAADLYVADMQPGLTRSQALTPLTQISGDNIGAGDAINDFDISPDGEQVAFTTRRAEFLLGSPAFVSAPLAEAGESELYDVDLEDDTLTRVTHGVDGEPSEQPHGSKLECIDEDDAYCKPASRGAQSPSFSQDGRVIAFCSTASNLVAGDGNGARFEGTTHGASLPDGSDAFVVERESFEPSPTQQYLSPAPAQSIAPLWRLGASAASRRNGTVVLYVQTPGAGALAAGASGAVPARAPAKLSRRGQRGKSGAAAGAHASARAAVLTRTVARVSRDVHEADGQLVTLVLKLDKRYAALATRSGGLYARVTLRFTAPGHAVARDALEVRFERVLPRRRRGRAKAKAKKATARRARGAGGR